MPITRITYTLLYYGLKLGEFGSFSEVLGGTFSTYAFFESWVLLYYVGSLCILGVGWGVLLGFILLWGLLCILGVCWRVSIVS
jgi:hypothetical protein